jgi:hypothetical protein
VVVLIGRSTSSSEGTQGTTMSGLTGKLAGRQMVVPAAWFADILGYPVVTANYVATIISFNKKTGQGIFLDHENECMRFNDTDLNEWGGLIPREERSTSCCRRVLMHCYNNSFI